MVELCGTYLHIQRPLIVISQDNLMLEQLPVEEKHLLNFDLSAQQQKKNPDSTYMPQKDALDRIPTNQPSEVNPIQGPSKSDYQ
jgi:hypothetical protein